MSETAGSRHVGRRTRRTPRRRDDVEALIALVSLDQSLAQRDAKGEAQEQAGSVELPERRAELASRRAALTRRLPPLAFEDYEAARRRGLLPAAVATRGRVCWGCFHHLSPALAGEFHSTEAFTCCPHCERVLFNPDWTERP